MLSSTSEISHLIRKEPCAMFKNQTNIYQSLNKLANPNGMIIFGGNNDISIPLCELKQAFSLDSSLYNRSFSDLSVDNAVEYYDTCIAKLNPESILLHIGEADVDAFLSSSSDFDKKYSKLISHIKNANKKCRVIIVSLKNYNNDSDISEMNKHLKYIADSERCEYADISAKRVWNPKQTKEIASFVYSTGFVRPLNIKRPAYDLAKILFCFEACCV